MGVQPFFGRPITHLRFDSVFVSFVSRTCLRLRLPGLLWLQVGDGGVVDRIDSPELKIDDFVVDGVVPVGDGSPGE